MATRDLLLFIGFLRSGKMFPAGVPLAELPTHRSLKTALDAMAEQEQAIFGKTSRPTEDDLRRRSAVASWAGDLLPLGTRIGEVPDPGVLLCLLYDGPVENATLPVEVFAQTLRRFALRDPQLRARFEEHVDRAGTFVPHWLSPEVRKQKSQEAFDLAMRAAREHGFAHAAPLFEGVRGDQYAPAQVAIAVYEVRELGDTQAALRRLTEVLRVAPRTIAARLQRAQLLHADAGRKVDAADDYLAILKELARPDSKDGSRQVRDAAMAALWDLHREFVNPKKLDAALALAKQDPEHGFEALSRYVHTHPCAWDAQTHLATLALARKKFDLTAKLLQQVRWLFPDDPNPHFVYGQAIASKGHYPAALRAFTYAARLAPNDHEIAEWLAFAERRVQRTQVRAEDPPSIAVADHVARSLLVLLGLVRGDRVYPAALVLHKVPGDVSLAFVCQSIAAQEQRRFAPAPGRAEAPVDLRGVAARSRLTDFAGEALSVDQTVGDVADPGVVVAILYDEPSSQVDPSRVPTPVRCRDILLGLVQQDSELYAKLDRHLKSPEAMLKQRLDY